MAAVKASLEEDLSRTQSELRDTRWELGEREREVGIQLEALNSELQRVSGELVGLKEEKMKVEEERGRLEGKVQEMAGLVEVKEQRWLAERAALENRTVELSCQVETLTDSLRASQQSGERERREERESWATQTAMLEDQVAGLTRELESFAARAREWDREVGELRTSAEKAQSLADSLQVQPLLSVTHLSLSLSLSLSLFSLSLSLTPCFPHLQAEYQATVAEKERSDEVYSSQRRALEEANSALLHQQSKASAENAFILQKQSELYREMEALQETKTEVMELCRRYEEMYNEERERRQADREQIRMMRAQGEIESESTAMECDALRRQLSEEKHATTRLGAESRSLKAQVSFLETKLRDLERARTQSSFTTQPQTTRPSHIRDTSTSDPHHCTYSRNEFDDTLISTDILVSHSLPFRDPAGATFSESTFCNPNFQSTAVKPQPHLLSLNSTRQPPPSVERGGGEEDDKRRLSELRSRNRKAPPHLQSSYAVELQEKRDDPCLLGGQRDRPRRKRAPGNATSLRLSSDSIAVLEESRKRSSGSRKLAGDLGSSGSPAPSRRRVSDPLTPHTAFRSTIEGDSSLQDPRRATMAPSYSLLRGRGREDENRPEVDEPPPATMFEMNFSPPARPKSTAAQLPERLKQRLAKQEKPDKPVSAAAPTSGKRPVAGKTVIKPHPTKRAILKMKN